MSRLPIHNDQLAARWARLPISGDRVLDRYALLSRVLECFAHRLNIVDCEQRLPLHAAHLVRQHGVLIEAERHAVAPSLLEGGAMKKAREADRTCRRRRSNRADRPALSPGADGLRSVLLRFAADSE